MPTRPKFLQLTFAREPYVRTFSNPIYSPATGTTLHDERVETQSYVCRALLPNGYCLDCRTLEPDQRIVFAPEGNFTTNLSLLSTPDSVEAIDLLQSRFMFNVLSVQSDDDGDIVLKRDDRTYNQFVELHMSSLPHYDDYNCLERLLGFLSDLPSVEHAGKPLSEKSRQPTCLLDTVQGPLDTTCKQDLGRPLAAGVVHLRHE